ncbi:hypothetical protein [methane-oxidizing endosymbiont of Gigantopelta aegis]|uniref:hypothetical protein n=1 Tax=methane-oxidizing endosymbiont of Gigantopelta aegis TaxID=2794938 RepID=UPI0018DB4A91|nr:hypothetical protein [methane-oxidizing endosymbiont of Gigantopelta aegis]
MIVYAINLFILSIVIFIVGMVKPGWIMFWMDKPSRMGVMWLAVLLFMGAAVLFGEGERQKKLAQSAQTEISSGQKSQDAAVLPRSAEKTHVQEK